MNAAASIYFGNAAGLVQEYAGYVQLRYHPGLRDFGDFRALLGHTTRALARHGTGKLIVDQRQMSPYTSEEQAYVVQQWLPRTIRESNYRYGALLQAHEVFARLAMDTIRMQAQDLPLTYRYFADEEEAVAWLRMH